MRIGSLFSGIGGLDLGLERAGMTVIWQCENDPYASRVLARHWPHVPNLGDITKVDWDDVEPVDLVCGGYPCQPFSHAGVRRGESDPRHLWPHMHRCIRHLRPRHALLENVPGHLSLGFGRVLGDLAEIGYDTEWFCIPAAAVGAPHLRWRLFAIATDICSIRRRQNSRSTLSDEGPHAGRAKIHDHIVGGDGPVRDVADADSRRRQQRDTGKRRVPVADEGRDVPDANSVEQGLRRRLQLEGGGDHDRHVYHWAVEPDVGRVAHGIPNRVDRLRCLGNAVVPQIAEWIGRHIMTESDICR